MCKPAQQRCTNILNNEYVSFDEKGVHIGTCIMGLKENNNSIFYLTYYKANLSSLTSQFDKVLYIGLNITIISAGTCI